MRLFVRESGGYCGTLLVLAWGAMNDGGREIGASIFCLLSTMSDGDEVAKLWKVNRTIHELVKDRVRKCFARQGQATHHRCRASRYPTTR